jgi:hypothetical protein
MSLRTLLGGHFRAEERTGRFEANATVQAVLDASIGRIKIEPQTPSRIRRWPAWHATPASAIET